MSELERIAQQHKLWCNMVRNMGCNESYVEDVVQDMYIKVSGRLEKGTIILYGGREINRFYIYLTLRSVFTDYRRTISRSAIVDIPNQEAHSNIFEQAESHTTKDYSVYQERKLLDLYEEIVQEMNLWDDKISYPYNKQLFLAYTGTSVSFRKLAKDTGIPFNSIVNGFLVLM